jgi:hypothetical protein
MVLLVINKATAPKRAGITIRHSAVYGTAKTYVLSAAQASITSGPTLTAVATNAFSYDMPAQSVSVVVPQL